MHFSRNRDILIVNPIPTHMKKALLLGLLLTSAGAGFSQSVTADQVKNNFVRTWKANYMLMNGMRIDAKAGIPMMVFEFRSDNTLQTYNTVEPNNRTGGSWKYYPDRKRIQVKIAGVERGYVTSITSDEMSIEMETSQMGDDDGSEMILILSPAN